jgi:cathepsin A (carboxypeptidase C)
MLSTWSISPFPIPFLKINSNASSQPAGVGFSTIPNITNAPTTLHAGAIDFSAFLSTFFTSIFPQYSTRPLHIAGESFGGHYVPGYVDYILSQRAIASHDAYWGPIQSIILVNAVIDMTYFSLGEVAIMCDGWGGVEKIFNETVCGMMRGAVGECERLGKRCSATLGQVECKEASDFCDDNIEVYYEQEVLAGRRSSFNCICSPPLSSAFPRTELSNANSAQNMSHLATLSRP